MNRMKKVVLMNFVFVMMLSLLPVLSLVLFGGSSSQVSALASQSDLSLRSGRQRIVTVTVPGTGEREVMTEADYLCGVVAANMPVEYDDEAIKAQAVASYTLMKYRRLHGTPEEQQSFITKKQMKQKWGKDFNKNYARLRTLVRSVYGKYIIYGEEPILAAYHEFSCGMTEYGADVCL